MENKPRFAMWEVDDEGNHKKLEINESDVGDYLNSELVFIILREDIRKLFFWKGAKSNVRKRFLGSRVATGIQGDLMKDGYHRCKIVSVDQGDEPIEFLNVFGLDSMEVGEDKLEDLRYIRNSEREEMKVAEIKTTKVEHEDVSKLGEIKELLKPDEKIVWVRSTTKTLEENWLKTLLKEDKKYKGRLKDKKGAEKLELKDYEIRCVVTNKNIILHHVFNPYFDYEAIQKSNFRLENEISILDMRGLKSFEIQGNEDDTFDIWFHSDQPKKGEYVFPFENLSVVEYDKFLDSFESTFRAEVPKKLKSLTYIRKKK